MKLNSKSRYPVDFVLAGGLLLSVLTATDGFGQNTSSSERLLVHRDRNIEYFFSRKAASGATNRWESACEQVRFRLPEYRRIADQYLKTTKNVKDPLRFSWYEIASIVTPPKPYRPPVDDSDISQSWYLVLHYSHKQDFTKTENVFMLFDGTIATERKLSVEIENKKANPK